MLGTSDTRTASLHHLCRAAQRERPCLPRTPERFHQRLRIESKQESQRHRGTQNAQETRPLRTLPQSLHPRRNSLHHLSQETSGTEQRLSAQPQSPDPKSRAQTFLISDNPECPRDRLTSASCGGNIPPCMLTPLSPAPELNIQQVHGKKPDRI